LIAVVSRSNAATRRNGGGIAGRGLRAPRRQRTLAELPGRVLGVPQIDRRPHVGRDLGQPRHVLDRRRIVVELLDRAVDASPAA